MQMRLVRCPTQPQSQHMLHVACHLFSEAINGMNIDGIYRFSLKLNSPQRGDSNGENEFPCLSS